MMGSEGKGVKCISQMSLNQLVEKFCFLGVVSYPRSTFTILLIGVGMGPSILLWNGLPPKVRQNDIGNLGCDKSVF